MYFKFLEVYFKFWKVYFKFLKVYFKFLMPLCSGMPGFWKVYFKFLEVYFKFWMVYFKFFKAWIWGGSPSLWINLARKNLCSLVGMKFEYFLVFGT